MMRADEAEARGDARAALELFERMPNGPDGKPFWRPWRLRRLVQLATLGPLLPRWATSRWILEQALQGLDDSRRPQFLKAMEIAVEIRGGEDRLTGVDPEDAKLKVVDHDWVFRQVSLYELGGLSHFVRRTASADLLAGADRIQEWARARMGAFRLLERAPATLAWENVATGDRIEVPNIGSGVFLVPGDYAIGRLVPTEQGQMFESIPLRVPPEVARIVADAPDDWLDALRAARVADDPPHTGGFRFGVLNDVPMPIVWAALFVGRTDPAPPTDAEAAGALLKVAREALAAGHEDRSPHELEVWPCLAAAVLEPAVAAGLAEVVRPGDAAVFVGLGEALAEPAAAVCRGLAELLRAEAA